MTNSQSLTTPHNTDLTKTFGLLITLYLAQGLPLGFITQALPAILREYEVSLKMIGWTGVLLAPWALKFLWAPVIDKVYRPTVGQNRRWMPPMQLIFAVLYQFSKITYPIFLILGLDQTRSKYYL